MSRDNYGVGNINSSRSPRNTRRDLSVDPASYYQSDHTYRPLSPRRSRSATRGPSPDNITSGGIVNSSFMDPHAVGMDSGGRSGSAPGSHHRSRSQSRNVGRNYHSLDREAHDREFMPIRDHMRDRSMDRVLDRGMDTRGLDRGLDPMSRRDRSLDRPGLLDDDMYHGRSRISPSHGGLGGPTMGGRDNFLMEMQLHNSELNKELSNLKKELELTNQKLGSSMHSIKTFWSPELKKERALRKEESAKYSLINDQLKLLNSENQVSDRSYLQR